jgi:hypothetical protein
MRTMRLWLDKNGSPDVRFEMINDETSILISIEFKDESVAHTFKQEFEHTLFPSNGMTTRAGKPLKTLCHRSCVMENQ